MLSLSGGGAKGAYAVGVLKGILENIEGSEGDYDVLSGVSVGSINALGIAIFDYGQRKEMVDFLSDLWLNLTSEGVYRSWP